METANEYLDRQGQSQDNDNQNTNQAQNNNGNIGREVDEENDTKPSITKANSSTDAEADVSATEENQRGNWSSDDIKRESGLFHSSDDAKSSDNKLGVNAENYGGTPAED